MTRWNAGLDLVLLRRGTLAASAVVRPIWLATVEENPNGARFPFLLNGLDCGDVLAWSRGRGSCARYAATGAASCFTVARSVRSFASGACQSMLKFARPTIP